jgi:HSP20 family molecular chaperone IbpA
MTTQVTHNEQQNQVVHQADQRTPNREQQTRSESKAELPVVVPAVDIFENENGITLLADMPGVNRNSVHLRLEDNTLHLEGDVALDVPRSLEPLLMEFNGRRYARSFTLSRELDTSNISAEMNAGVLKVNIPKAEAHKPRKIEVKVS